MWFEDSPHEGLDLADDVAYVEDREEPVVFVAGEMEVF